MPRGCLVYNPSAGRFPSWLLSERAANVLREQGWELSLQKTHDAKHLTQLARQAAKQGLDAFFVVGGDGSVNLAVAGLAGTDTALGILPAGTANVWAQELGLPGLTWTRWMALEESARYLAAAEVRFVDIGLCNDLPFLLWAGVGLDAFVVRRIEPRARWMKHFAVIQYAASAVWNASFWHGLNLNIQVDGKEMGGHFLLAVVTNIHLYAGGIAELSPDARLDDGQMDLWLFQGETLGDTVMQAWDLWSGRHVQSGNAFRFPFHSLEMKSDTQLFMQLDGEPVEGNGSVSIRVLPKALRVLVPQKTPHHLFLKPVES
jgi:YegS/Rv2252/BmrU family lipid kinase